MLVTFSIFHSVFLIVLHIFYLNLALETEALKQENTHLKHICDNQKYSVADIERLNSEREELQQAVNKVTKQLEAEQQQLWNEELKYAKGKEAVCYLKKPFPSFFFSLPSPLHTFCCCYTFPFSRIKCWNWILMEKILVDH